MLQRVALQPSAFSPHPSAVPPIVHEVLRAPGQPLDAATRALMEPRFGHDFSAVRVHTDGAATESARAVNALAYTVGQDIVFGTAQYTSATNRGRHVLAHELTHVMQQNGHLAKPELKLSTTGNAAEREADQIAGKITRQPDDLEAFGIQHVGLSESLQRYEAGEHAELGATERQFKDLASPPAITYKVKKGEMPEKIAADFGINVEELKELNKDKLHKWRTSSGPTIQGFNEGESIVIPPKLNPAVKDALKISGQMIVSVKGAKLEYGDIIAMSGDMFEDVKDLLTMSQAQLEEIAKLIKEEKVTHKALDSARWDKATGGRFTKLAQKNEKHFAPSNAALMKPSGVASAGDHKSEWEKFHKMALGLAQQGKKDEALLHAAFGDHYLTDAFAAGHLFNKRDVMELFNSQLPTTGTGNDREFTKGAEAFFNAVANASWVGSVATEFSRLKLGKPKYGIRWDMDSASRFSSLLQGVHLKEPDLLGSVIAKAAHDELNTLPGGLEVQNNRGDKWQLSGDNTLNPATKLIAKEAVAQSQLNVLSSMNATGKLDIPGMLKKVWDYTPIPTAPSVKVIQDKVKSNTDPTNTKLINAVAALITREHKLIIEKLIERGELMKK